MVVFFWMPPWAQHYVQVFLSPLITDWKQDFLFPSLIFGHSRQPYYEKYPGMYLFFLHLADVTWFLAWEIEAVNKAINSTHRRAGHPLNATTGVHLTSDSSCIRIPVVLVNSAFAKGKQIQCGNRKGPQKKDDGITKTLLKQALLTERSGEKSQRKIKIELHHYSFEWK